MTSSAARAPRYRTTAKVLGSRDYARVATHLRALERILEAPDTPEDARRAARADAHAVERHLGTLRPRAHNQHQIILSTGELDLIAHALYGLAADSPRRPDAHHLVDRVVREIDRPGTWEASA
ncbi:hypothetical protein NBH00_12805 [Paraconexibacter antarcticus]|uniref:Uncharacterized protein n=1 Tax=Paraconexibacter antarcticus TaxID=2949664 RepID=A0ABY5DMA3_9ACTN|nr:hypothetical protein [Paraconexibacter antarcticus]UTI62248.1 hypothetical protein NBH00_12805 [Paraconexibacter antarcticus]